MYKRLDVYPDGTKIPESLPDRYQSSSNDEVPAGQKCRNCKYYDSAIGYCEAFDAPVKSRWWCATWKPIKLMLGNSADGLILSKKITTNTVEEHFFEDHKKPLPAMFNIQDDAEVVKLDGPLVIMILEFVKDPDNASTELSDILEKLLDLSEDSEVLTIKDYPAIVQK